MIPAKADPNTQAAYLQQTIEPRLAEARAGQRTVFFVDADPLLRPGTLGAPAVQRPGGLECNHPRTDHRDQRHVHHR